MHVAATSRFLCWRLNVACFRFGSCVRLLVQSRLSFNLSLAFSSSSFLLFLRPFLFRLFSPLAFYFLLFMMVQFWRGCWLNIVFLFTSFAFLFRIQVFLLFQSVPINLLSLSFPYSNPYYSPSLFLSRLLNPPTFCLHLTLPYIPAFHDLQFSALTYLSSQNTYNYIISSLYASR